mgnify:CR=1 FL=1
MQQAYQMWYKNKHFCISFRQGLARKMLYTTIVLISLLFSSCRHPMAQAVFDEAFMLLYPDLSQAVASKFQLDSVASPGAATQLLEKMTDPKTTDNQSLKIIIASPSVTPVIQEFASKGCFALINLLTPANGFYSVEWDNAWAYRQIGLLAGYRLAVLQKETDKNASAALLFARGIGRSDTCLLYTSDAADDLHCVDLGGRRIIKKKIKTNISISRPCITTN